METPVSVDRAGARELPIVAGHLALDFANTIDDPEGPARHDHIATYPGLLEWAVRTRALTSAQARRLHRAAGSRPDGAAAALQQAHALRRTLQSVFTGVAAGRRLAPEQWTHLRACLVDALAHAQPLPVDTGYAWGWPEATRPDAMLWPVAHAAGELLTSGDLHRVKQCAGCPWLFLDRSRNSSRRWCAMNDCGTHAKIQRYVARRAARRSSPG